MKNFIKHGLAACFIVLLLVAQFRGAHAQDGMTLDDAGLLKTLTDMGLAPSPLTHGYLITLKSGTFTVYVQVVLSGDKSRIGINANLGVVDEATVTADQWKKVLAANGDSDPYYFYYDPETKKLYFHFSMENRDVTPTLIKHFLDEFVAYIPSTSDVWSFTK